MAQGSDELITASVAIDSPVGNLLIHMAGGNIQEVKFLDHGDGYPRPEKYPGAMPDLLKKAVHQLEAYFAGTLRVFDLPLSPIGTDFQKNVWNRLQEIPYGRTISYRNLAQRLGDELVIRAAASANGKNPIAIIIPCHRVIGTNGELTGYAGGLPRKKFLLELESRTAHGVQHLF